MVTEKLTNSREINEQSFNQISSSDHTEVGTTSLNQLIDSECCTTSISQCADILMAQLISQSDSQINRMVEDLANTALRSTMELTAC